MLNYRYTDNELKELLGTLAVIVDSREKANLNIIKPLEDKGVFVRREALSYGDYSFVLPCNEKMGISRDVYLNKQIAVERKNSLDELSGNISDGRTQFENELMRAQAAGCQLWLLVENSLGWSAISNHQYQTKLTPKSFAASLHVYAQRFGLRIAFVRADEAASWIYNLGYYFCREILKG